MDRGLAARSRRDGRDVRTGFMTLPSSGAAAASMAAVRAERRRCSSWTGRSASQSVREIEPRRVSDRMSPMKFRYRKPVALGAGFAIAIAVALVALGWRRSANEGPTYEGRSLSAWVGLIDQSHYPDRESTFFLQTSNAIVQIGTNGLPYLMEWIRYRPSRTLIVFGSAIEEVSFRLPSTPFGDAIVNRTLRGFRRADDAVVAFEILGNSAASCVNELSSIANDPGNPAAATRATLALRVVGPAAYPVLLRIASATNAPNRWIAINALGVMGTNAASAVPMLIQTLADSGGDYARTAAHTLGRIALEPESVIPALIFALQHQDALMRWAAADSLAAFGTNAFQAVPALQLALSDHDPYVREAASNALQVINSAPAAEAAAR